MTRRKYLFGTYTHRCKAYVDADFYGALGATADAGRDDRYLTVDNSPSQRYVRSLERRYSGFSDFVHLDIPRQGSSRATFLNNVAVSANALRARLLESDCDHLVTIESDVIVPVDLPELLDEALDMLDTRDEHWGAVGGLYYGFHHAALKDLGNDRLEQSDDVFSGCTCYNRRMLKSLRFRWSKDDTRPFPDAWMKHDAARAGYSLWLYNKIKCRHIRGRWIRFFWSRFQ